jgi:hypothetical protein
MVFIFHKESVKGEEPVVFDLQTKILNWDGELDFAICVFQPDYEMLVMSIEGS